MEELIKQQYNALHESLNKLVSVDGMVAISSYGIIIRFETLENAMIYAKYAFPNDDHYTIYDDTYALAE